MNLAHSNTVGDDRLAALSISLDVRGIEKLNMAEAAECALTLVCQDHASTKQWLVKTPLYSLRLISHGGFGHSLRASMVPFL
jgi:hypothetical protein